MAENAKDQAPAGALRLLHVEDSPIDAELILRQLKRQGLRIESRRVYTEKSFREGLAVFVPDIVLSDYSMPEFDGLSALGIMREIAPHTPFIFVSGSIRPDDAARAFKQGAADFLTKEDLGRLRPAIEKALKLSGAHPRL
ncbi:MAG: hypothetical protein JWN94_530 [Betaproteobacteria bacterium]|nr:hypothetical protein [Betaproteobacteria bacterium]